jgi:hypothetical protein
MKGSRFSEEQIIGILREHEAGREDSGGLSAPRDFGRHVLQMESQVWRAGCLRGATAQGSGG